jgi:hypothetical protein
VSGVRKIKILRPATCYLLSAFLVGVYVGTEVKPHEGELNPGIPKNACTEVSVAFATDPVKLSAG